MRRLSDERGAVLIIVSICLVLLVGMAAFVMDASALYQERRELQNGADAAALAVAEDCARGLPCTLATANTRSDSLAGANAEDDASDAVVEAAGFDPTGSVTVKTSTKNLDGTTAIRYVFEPVLDIIGGDDADEKMVTASATAIWGSPSSLTTLPLIVSKCEWSAATRNDTLYELAAGGYSNTDADGATERTLMFHDGGSTSTCSATAGMDVDADGKLPGGFGWLVPDDDACNVTSTSVDGEGDWVVRDPGADTECYADELRGLLGKVVAVPVFEDFCRFSSKGCPDLDVNGDMYRVYAYSGFYITGYDLGGPSYEQYDSKTRTRAPDCGTKRNDDRCITGYFTETTFAGGEVGGPSAGVIVITLVD